MKAEATSSLPVQALGWPCAGTHWAIVRNMIELAPDDIKHSLVILPRAAAAADAHGY